MSTLALRQKLNSVDIKNNAVSSLTQTNLKVSYQIHLNTNGTGVITE